MSTLNSLRCMRCFHSSMRSVLQLKYSGSNAQFCISLLTHRPVRTFLNVSSLQRQMNNFKRHSLMVTKNQQPLVFKRFFAAGRPQSKNNTTVLIYFSAAAITMIGASYAGVPLYRMFCQATGLGGQAVAGHDTSKIESMSPVRERILKVKFNADIASSMQWNFRPQQTEVIVAPGETALAFYRAKNPTDKPIIGISTYNVVPFEAGQYFNKIQCFCFEEQRLNPHEEVDMPVFFYIDPDYTNDPKLEKTDQITLSYTFFEAKEGMSLPLPGYVQQKM